jgi:hypothetical protein
MSMRTAVLTRVRRVLLVAGLALAVLVVFVLAASRAQAAEVVDQSQPNFNHSTDISPGFGTSDSYAQTFTPGGSGILDQVDLGLGLDCAGCASGVLNVGIYATDGSGFPTGAALGTGTVSPSNPSLGVGCCTLITVPISPVSVSAGTKYAIVLTDTNCCGAGFILGLNVDGPYLRGDLQVNFGGSGWQQDSFTDAVFQTYLNVSSGPTSKAQCKNGGWRDFGDMFKNQGSCVTLFDT